MMDFIDNFFVVDAIKLLQMMLVLNNHIVVVEMFFFLKAFLM
jgi:hypothetical protein